MSRTFEPGPLAAGFDGVPAKPSVRLWGWSTRLASDDASVCFFIPLTVSIGFLATAILLIVALVENVCNETDLALGFAIAWVALASAGLLVELLRVACSCRGSITEEMPRIRFVTWLLGASIVVGILELCAMVLGAVLFFTDEFECDQVSQEWNNRAVLEAVAILGFIFIVLRTLRLSLLFRNCFCCCKCYSGSQIARAEGGRGYGTLEMQERGGWVTLLRCICCSPRIHPDEADTQQDMWLELSEIFSQVFGDEEYTWSDLFTGLRIVHQSHRYMRADSEAKNHGKAGSRLLVHNQIRRLRGTSDAAVVSEAAHVLSFAYAIFSWPIECYTKGPVAACAGMCGTCLRTSCAHSVETTQDCCRVRRLSVLSQCNVHPDDVIELDLRSGVYEQPFAVILDRPKKAVVVAVRGTFGVADLVTDGLASLTTMELGNGMNTHVHRGMLRAARILVRKLVTNGALRRAAAAIGHNAADYEVITTGHSLGASLASLLAILLQFEDIGGLSNVRCVAFSPAPIVDRHVAAWSESFITAVVLGHDMVARLQLWSVLRLKAEIDFALRNSRDKKASVCFSYCGANLHDRYWETYDMEAYLDKLDLPPRTFIPGRILYIIKDSEEPTCMGHKRRFRPYWATVDAFDRIWISGRMAWDHFPRSLRRSVEEMVSHVQAIAQEESPSPSSVVLDLDEMYQHTHSENGEDAVTSALLPPTQKAVPGIGESSEA